MNMFPYKQENLDDVMGELLRKENQKEEQAGHEARAMDYAAYKNELKSLKDKHGPGWFRFVLGLGLTCLLGGSYIASESLAFLKNKSSEKYNDYVNKVSLLSASETYKKKLLEESGQSQVDPALEERISRLQEGVSVLESDEEVNESKRRKQLKGTLSIGIPAVIMGGVLSVVSLLSLNRYSKEKKHLKVKCNIR